MTVCVDGPDKFTGTSASVVPLSPSMTRTPPALAKLAEPNADESTPTCGWGTVTAVAQNLAVPAPRPGWSKGAPSEGMSYLTNVNPAAVKGALSTISGSLLPPLLPDSAASCPSALMSISSKPASVPPGSKLSVSTQCDPESADSC